MIVEYCFKYINLGNKLEIVINKVKCWALQLTNLLLLNVIDYVTIILKYRVQKLWLWQGSNILS